MIEHDLTTVFSLKASDLIILKQVIREWFLFFIGDKNVWLDDLTKDNLWDPLGYHFD